MSPKTRIVLSTAALGLVALGSRMRGAPAVPANPAATFQQYCYQCHGNGKSTAGVNLDQLLAKHNVGETFQTWQKIAAVLEQGKMPPKGLPQPSDEQRQHAAIWIHTELNTYARNHAGDPGHVTVRRLTSGEYEYSVEDLTGVDLDVAHDFANDSVGGEGFMNFGDVQFVQDASLERYLETAKMVADHAVIGAGPLEFYQHPGNTGFELSAISRIKDIYAKYGFRTVSGEGGDSFGLDKYSKALYVAWRYKNRAALGEPNVQIKDLAAKEGISLRFSEHIWSVLNNRNLGYPSSEIAARWNRLPAPTADKTRSEDTARAGCDELRKYIVTWPSWLFARGDKAAGGAGDESPLLFTDAALKADTSRRFAFNVGGGRGGRAMAPPKGPLKIYLNVALVAADQTARPVVIWKNPTILVRRPGQGRGPGGAGAAAPPPPTATESAAAQDPTSAAAIKRAMANAGTRIPLNTFVTPETAAELHFGTSPDGTQIGPTDFATEGPGMIELPLPPGAVGLEFQAEATLGANREQVIRIAFSDRADGPPRGIPIHGLLGDMETAGYRKFKAGVLELVELMPPNSHSEPTPADKDPPPAPFDPTYNTPEHDAFDTLVKYEREDKFVVDHMLDDANRARLEHAWQDLHASFDYYDNYLGLLAAHFKYDLKNRKIARLSAADVAAMPAEMQPFVKPLRSEYLETVSAEAASHAGHVEDALKFASRAWRRPLTEREKESLRGFYRQALAQSDQDHRKAIRSLLARILVSPEFLYRVEQASDVVQPRALNNWEIASRLSYFLWSSIPDEELRHAAAAGELQDTAHLRAQVKRMLTDPRARRLSTEFFGQWLGFYHFDQFKGVDTGRFPEFTDEVRSGMYDEAVSFFEYIVCNDRPNREILYADYDFLSKPLAKYYGVNQDLIRSARDTERVEGANAYNRGGLLRLGAVLTTTSAPLRTSPVKRGDWVLRRVLGTPTPPPPPDAGSIPNDPKLFGGLSIHDRLEAHKRNATCAACHTRIDPLGFPLEHYDSTGRWRDKYDDGKAIDDTGDTNDKVHIAGVNGLLDYLRSKDDLVRRTLANKLIGYSLGRTVQLSDQPLIERMISAGGNAPISELIADIVTSKQFRDRLGREESVEAKPPAKAAGREIAALDRVGKDKAGAK